MGVWGHGGSWVHITATHASPLPPPQGQRGQGSCCRGEIRDYEHTASRGRCRCCTSWGGTGGTCAAQTWAPPPHTLQSTGQQQRPRGVQSWVSLLVPALLHELGGLRQPPPDSKSLVAGGGVQWPRPGGSRGDAGVGGSWRPSLPSPGSRAPGRRGGGSSLELQLEGISLAPWGHVGGGGVGKQNLRQVGMDPAPGIWSRCSGGGGVSHEPLGQAGGPWRG